MYSLIENNAYYILGSILVVWSFAGSLLFLVIMLYVFSHSLSKYGIVIDAGSSHSALWMFSWDSRKVNNTGVISTYDREEGHSSEYLWILLVDSTTTGSWYYKVFIIILLLYFLYYVYFIILLLFHAYTHNHFYHSMYTQAWHIVCHD